MEKIIQKILTRGERKGKGPSNKSRQADDGKEHTKI